MNQKNTHLINSLTGKEITLRDAALLVSYMEKPYEVLFFKKNADDSNYSMLFYFKGIWQLVEANKCKNYLNDMISFISYEVFDRDDDVCKKIFKLLFHEDFENEYIILNECFDIYEKLKQKEPLMAFNDQVINLKTLEIRKLEKSDFIIHNTKYDYVKDTEQIDKIKKKLSEISNEKIDLLMKYFASCLDQNYCVDFDLILNFFIDQHWLLNLFTNSLGGYYNLNTDVLNSLLINDRVTFSGDYYCKQFFESNKSYCLPKVIWTDSSVPPFLFSKHFKMISLHPDNDNNWYCPKAFMWLLINEWYPKLLQEGMKIPECVSEDTAKMIASKSVEIEHRIVLDLKNLMNLSNHLPFNDHEKEIIIGLKAIIEDKPIPKEIPYYYLKSLSPQKEEQRIIRTTFDELIKEYDLHENVINNPGCIKNMALSKFNTMVINKFKETINTDKI